MTKEQLTEQLLKECAIYAAEEVNKSAGSVPHSVAVANFLFSKLAEIELRLRKLEATTVRRLANSNDDTDF